MLEAASKRFRSRIAAPPIDNVEKPVPTDLRYTESAQIGSKIAPVVDHFFAGVVE
jgi:hypothetical protein